MLLRIAYKTLMNIEAGLFIASGILIVIAAVINSNVLMKELASPPGRNGGRKSRSTEHSFFIWILRRNASFASAFDSSGAGLKRAYGASPTGGRLDTVI